MALKFGYATQGMFSFKTKEATYGAAVTINASNFFSLKGAKIKVEWPDMVVDDGDMVTGYEFPTEQEIQEQDVRITITEERAHPAFVAAAMALSTGSSTPAQDGILVAYRHKAVPMAAGTAMPSINAVVDLGGIKYLYKGLFAESVKISGQRGGYLTCELVLRGSGARAADVTDFVASVSESWLKVRNIRAWMESGTDISIAATPTQGAEDISSATPDVLSNRFKSFEFSWNNNPEKQLDNLGVDHGKRAASLKFGLNHNDTTEVGYYENQAALAFEIDLDSGTIIASTGAFKYGMDMIFPLGKLKKAPLPDGGTTGILDAEYEVLLMDNGTDPIFQCYTYNAIPAFLA